MGKIERLETRQKSRELRPNFAPFPEIGKTIFEKSVKSLAIKKLCIFLHRQSGN
jgi:hypothetical protein